MTLQDHIIRGSCDLVDKALQLREQRGIVGLFLGYLKLGLHFLSKLGRGGHCWGRGRMFRTF